MKVLDYDGTDHLIDKIYDAINSGGSADYIVEEGQNGIWYYRKWASGIAECWGRLTSAETTATSYNFNGYLPSGIMDDTTPKYITASGGFSGVPDSHIGYCRCSPAGRYDMYIFRSATISRVAEMDVFIKGLWKEFTPSVMKQGQSLRTWNFTPASGISMSQNGAVVRNGIAIGTLIINGSFNATANTYKQIGTTTDKPQGDYVLFDCYRGSDALYEGVIRVTSSGSVDLNTVRGITSGTIYLQLVYTLTD